MQATLERLRQRREEMKDEGGFTLIELLIVIVILAILAAIVVFAVQNLSTQSAKAACQSDFKTVETAVEGYKVQEGSYPSLTGPTFGVVAGDANGVNALMQTDTSQTPSIGPWLKDIPYNQHHFQIVVSVTPATAGQIDVYTAPSAAPATDNGINGGALAAATPTHTAADCSSVT
jgi:general secretion pathway protein G